MRRSRRKISGRCRPSHRREALCPRESVEEGRRRLARGRVHSELGLQGARQLRTGVGAGNKGGGQLEPERESLVGRRKAAVRVRGRKA